MKKQISITIATFFCAAATASTAAAADYVITWKNQFATNATCTLNTSLVSATGTVPNSVTYSFASVGQTKPVTVSSLFCSRISLSAHCSYTDGKGQPQRNNFGSQTASCSNHTVTLNPTIPGSITVTDTSPKPPHGVL